MIFITHDTSILSSAETVIVPGKRCQDRAGYISWSLTLNLRELLERAMMLWGDDDDTKN